MSAASWEHTSHCDGSGTGWPSTAVVFPIRRSVQYPVISNGLSNRPFRIMVVHVCAKYVYNKFLIGWVAIQYIHVHVYMRLHL